MPDNLPRTLLPGADLPDTGLPDTGRLVTGVVLGARSRRAMEDTDVP